MPLLKEDELVRIKEAVSNAERATSGEIVPVIVEQSGAYQVAIWRGASIVALLSLTLSILVFNFYHGWSLAWLFTGWGTATVALAAGLIGALVAAYVPAVKRLLAGSHHIIQTVHRAAMQAFVEEEVFNTRERTGILLFISLFEHRIEVLGDAGINQRVTDEEWAGVIGRIQDGIRKGRLADGIIEALGMCGQLLARAGVEIRSDDTNELNDNLRIRNG